MKHYLIATTKDHNIGACTIVLENRESGNEITPNAEFVTCPPCIEAVEERSARVNILLPSIQRG